MLRIKLILPFLECLPCSNTCHLTCKGRSHSLESPQSLQEQMIELLVLMVITDGEKSHHYSANCSMSFTAIRVYYKVQRVDNGIVAAIC